MNGFKLLIFLIALGVSFNGWSDSRINGTPTKTSGKVHVTVASDDWPPLLTKGPNPDDTPVGFIADFFKYANAIQSKFDFEVVVMPFPRIQREVAHGNVDVVAMKNLAWMGDLDLTSSDPVLHSGDVYIALDKPGRTQAFFQAKRERHWVGVNGYHYGFANFNSDVDFLSKNFKIQLVTDNASVIHMILRGRGEAGVVPETVLTHFIESERVEKGALLIGDAYDSTYTLSHLLRNKGPVNAEQMNEIIFQLQQSGKLQMLIDKVTLKR